MAIDDDTALVGSVRVVMHRMLIVLLLLGALPSHAAIYKWVAPDGRVIYSDQPRPGAQQVLLPPPPVHAAPPSPPSTAPRGTPQSKPSPLYAYTRLAIVKPGDDTTIRDNRGRVAIELAIQPPLLVQAGHVVLLKLDGRPIGKPSATMQFTLENVDRGTHTLQAVIQDAGAKPLRESTMVRFHLKRISLLQRRGR